MDSGEISRNTATDGGGVCLTNGIFTMNGGEISGNKASGNGGGIVVSGMSLDKKITKFSMEGGKISRNTASAYGAGVYVENWGCIFNKTGGSIYGYSKADSNSNTVKNNSGVVQKSHGHTVYIDPKNNLYKMGKDSTSVPTDELSFNGSTNPPTYNGSWEF